MTIKVKLVIQQRWQWDIYYYGKIWVGQWLYYIWISIWYARSII